MNKLIALAVMAVFFVGAFAQEKPGTVRQAPIGAKDTKRRLGLEGILKQIHLSTAQTQQVKAILKESRQEIKALRSKDTTKEAQRQEVRQIHQRVIAKIRSILTTDQRIRFDNWMAQRNKRIKR